MADNLTTTPGAGATVRARDTGTALVQVNDVYPGVATITGAPVSFTVGSTATGKSGGATFTLPAGTTHVRCSVVTDAVKFTEDGSTVPSATVGNLLTVGTYIELDQAMALNFIRVTSDASVTLSPRKYV
jgi:hypothetical protein